MCLAANAQDATHTAGLRRSAFARIRERLRGAYRELAEYIDSIPVSVEEIPEGPVTNRRVYTFDLVDRDTDAEIHRIVNAWFATGADSPPPRWFMSQFAGQAYQAGTAQEGGRIQGLASQAGVSSAELSQFDVESILQTRAYRSRIDKVHRRMFEEMKGFTTDTANDLARTLANGVARGQSPRDIKREIRGRFEVSESSAQRIARTEIGHSYRDARRDTTIDARDRLEMDVREQWISALGPTTRPTHAERHLNIYTPEEIADFYSRDANEINCLCSSQSVIVTADNKILGERKMTKRDEEEIERILAA